MIEPSNVDLGDTPDSVIEYMNALEQENKALMAQVEQLRKPLSALVKTCHDRGGALQEDGQFAYKVKEFVFKSAKNALEATPAQCLAEIKAQAGRDGFSAGYDAGYQAGRVGADNHALEETIDYANQLRQKAKGE